MDAKMFAILGLHITASKQDIKQAYRRLSLEHHPDRNGNSLESKQRFQKEHQQQRSCRGMQKHGFENDWYWRN